jgi:acetyl esterase/lipase
MRANTWPVYVALSLATGLTGAPLDARAGPEPGRPVAERGAEGPGTPARRDDSEPRLKGSATGRLLPEVCGCKIATDVPYGPGAGQSNLMNVYTPVACEPGREGPFPVIVYIHGGAWVGGHRGVYDEIGIDEVCNDGQDCVPRGPFYARRGIAGFSISYTLAQVSASSWPQAIRDVVLAIRHIRDNADAYNIDRDRIAVLGHSAGGHLASLAGTLSGDEDFLRGVPGSSSSRVSLVMDYFGPTDFEFVGVRREEYRPYGAIQGFLGGSFEDFADTWRDASPVTHVTTDDPVFVIAHGTDDGDVSYPISESFRDKLTIAGVETHFVRIEGGHHGFTNEEDLSVRYVLEPLLRRVFDLEPPDPIAELEQLASYTASLPAIFFRPAGMSGSERGRTLAAKLAEVIRLVEAGLVEEALDKLRYDIRAKVDGGTPAQDWVVDPAIRSRLCGLIDHIAEGLEDLQTRR